MSLANLRSWRGRRQTIHTPNSESSFSMPKGGARPGAGRPKGSKNHRRQVRIPAKTIENGVLPLDYMLAMMRDDQIEPQRRDNGNSMRAVHSSAPRRRAAGEHPWSRHRGGGAAAVNIVSIPRGGRIDPKTGVVTAEEIVPIKPFQWDTVARAERSARA